MKLRITIDIFSGLPNPSWVLGDAKQVADLLERLEASPSASTSPHEVPSKLGLRAVHVERLDDRPPAAAQGPGLWVVAPGTAADPAAAAQLAEDLVNTAPAGPLATADTLLQLPPELQEYVIGEIRQWPTNPGSDQRSSGSGPLIAPPAPELGQIICPYDTVTFAPASWNDRAHILLNNCYNYASNIRNDTFAQPGWKHGYRIPPACTLDQVAQGARADGYRADGNCQPPTATNRWLVALVAGASRAASGTTTGTAGTPRASGVTRVVRGLPSTPTTPGG